MSEGPLLETSREAAERIHGAGKKKKKGEQLEEQSKKQSEVTAPTRGGVDQLREDIATLTSQLEAVKAVIEGGDTGEPMKNAIISLSTKITEKEALLLKAEAEAAAEPEAATEPGPAAEPEAAAAAHKASLTVGTAVTWTEANLPGDTGGIIAADPFGSDIMGNRIWVVGAETGEGDFFFPRMLTVANQEEADRIVAITGKRKEAEAAHKASLPVGTTVTWRTGARTELEGEIGGYVVGEEEDCGDGVMGVDIIGAESGETDLLPYADVVLATPLEIKQIAKAALSGAGSNEPDIIRFAEPLLAASDSTSPKAKKLRIRELVKRGIEEDIARQLLVDAGGDLGVALSRLSVAMPEGEDDEEEGGAE